MAQHENVIGMKDSAGNLPVLEEYLGAQSDSFTVLTGNGATAAGAVHRGARGAILAIALYAGLPVRALMDAALAGRHDEAAQLQVTMLPLATGIAGAFGPAGIKAAMELVGLDGGAPRAPLLPCDGREFATVKTLLKLSGLLPAT
jgi:4-hydroxy-2-oxoglutarate aldolase